MTDPEAPLLPRRDFLPDLEDFLALKAEDCPPYCGTLNAALVPRSEILFVHGDPRTLKTWSFTSMLLCAASNRPWLDLFPCEQARILYLQGDGGRLKWNERLHKLMRGMGLSPKDLKDWFRTDMRNGRVLAFRDHIDGLIEACGDWHPQIAVFDPLARFLAGELDENSSRDMGIFIARIEQFQVAWPDCTLIFPHHENKDKSKEGGAAMRGSGVLWAAASTARARAISRTKSELDFVLKDYAAPPPFVVEVEIGTEIATVSYRGSAENDEKREKKASVIVAFQDADGPLTFKNIEDASGLPRQTVRRLVLECLDEGLLEEDDPALSKHQKSRSFTLSQTSI